MLPFICACCSEDLELDDWITSRLVHAYCAGNMWHLERSRRPAGFEQLSFELAGAGAQPQE